MPDIFDKVAGSAKGDIFDKVAAQPPPINPALSGATQATSISPAPKSSLDFSDPVALGQSLAEKTGILDWVRQSQNLTPEGAAQHPIQNVVGKAAGFLIGGNQGIGTSKEGILTNPVTGTLLGAIPGAAAARAATEAGPLRYFTASKTTGANMLEQASAKAGSAPIHLSAHTNELVDELVQHSKSGGEPIKVVSDLLERLGPSTKQAAEAVPGPLTYDEARIFQQNISSLSAEEQAAFKGTQKGLLKQLAKSFGNDVQSGADAAGIGTEHAAGMSQYAIASARNRALVKAGKAALAGAGIGGVVGGTDYLIRKAIEKAKQ